MHHIEYDTLGNGSDLYVNFDCVDEAKTGEQITFTLKLVVLKDKFDD